MYKLIFSCLRIVLSHSHFLIFFNVAFSFAYSNSSGTSPSSSVLSTPLSATVAHSDGNSVLAGTELGGAGSATSQTRGAGQAGLRHQSSNSSFSSLDRVSMYSTTQPPEGGRNYRRHKRGVGRTL